MADREEEAFQVLDHLISTYGRVFFHRIVLRLLTGMKVGRLSAFLYSGREVDFGAVVVDAGIRKLP